MDPATKTHTVPSIRTNSAARVASPHGSAQHPHHRSHPPLHRQRRSPIWKDLPRSVVLHPRVINSVSQMISSPSPAPPVLQLPIEQRVGCEADLFLVTADAPPPFKWGLSGSFNISGDARMCRGSLTPATSIAGSQQVTSSRWHPPAPFSPLTLQDLDSLSAKQATEIYQLATECQALGSDLAKRFQTICGLKASHCAAAQATTHETVLSRCLIHSTAYAVAATTQQAEKWESTLCRLQDEANKVWKDANDVIF